MSAAGLFAPDGDFYTMVAHGLALLGDPEYLKRHPKHRGFQLAAHLVYHAVVDLLAAGKIELGEEVTDAFLQANSPWLKGKSRSFIQKGMYALDHILGWIERIRQHGRRIIRFVNLKLRGRGAAGALPPPTRSTSSPAPPQTPPEEFKQQTTTDSRSSSSSEGTQEETEEKTPNRDDPAIAALIARACKLIPEASPGEVAHDIGKYSAESVARALDRVEEVNRTSGRTRVHSWGFVVGILENRRKKGWTPPPPKPAPQQPAAAKAPAEPVGPPPVLSTEEVAELVGQCRRRDTRTYASVRLRMALREGAIPPELLATIPADVLAGLEVPAAGSGS